MPSARLHIAGERKGSRWDQARLLASIGVNGCNVNNVNGAAPFLIADNLPQLARIADAMRPWGVRMALSVD
ncbi:MAG: hypothetical protein WBF64_02995, partial [Xanthobacteraceae bacterium]